MLDCPALKVNVPLVIEFVKSQIKRYEVQRNFFINQKKTWRTSLDALRALREFDHESYKKY